MPQQPSTLCSPAAKKQYENRHGHLVRDSDEYVRGLLDGYDRLRISGAAAAKDGYVGGT
jgi:hypothetical protein